MTPVLDVRLLLPDEAATLAFAGALAPVLRAGDVLALAGDIGAGKSVLARAVIRARLAAAGAPPEDIPSPTFTLVQVYEADGLEIWHSDLYRLGGPDDAFELGLDAAFETGLCLIEWPDRLAGTLPVDALCLTLTPASPDTPEQARKLHLLADDGDWRDRLAPILAEVAT